MYNVAVPPQALPIQNPGAPAEKPTRGKNPAVYSEGSPTSETASKADCSSPGPENSLSSAESNLGTYILWMHN